MYSNYRFLLAVLFAAFSVHHSADALTSSQVNQVSNDVATAFGLVNSYGTACNAANPSTPCPVGDNIG